MPPSMWQTFLDFLFILQVIKSWRMKQPGNEANETLGGNLVVSYPDHVLPSETLWSGNETCDLGMRLVIWEWDQNETRSVYIEKDFFQGGLWDRVVEDHGGHLLVTLQYLEEGNNLRVPGKQTTSQV